MFETRIKKLQETLSNFELDAILITSSYNAAYLTGIFAFSHEEREARILVIKNDIYLFTDARYTEMVKVISPFVTLIEISAKNPFFKALQNKINSKSLKYLGFEEENITYREIADLEEDLNDVEFIPLQNIVEKLRETKDTDEIEKIKKACRLTDMSFEYILKFIKPGISELEIKKKLENYVRNEGGEISFPSIVAFGSNSAIPHHMSDNTKLKTEDIILLDFGAKVDGYCADMTRTVFLGKPPKKLEEMYIAVKKSQEIALGYLQTHINKGFKSSDVHNLASKYLEEEGFSHIPHSIGHGVGLQVHEMPWLSPYSEDKLKQNMIVTVEPGVYIPVLGGVRIEDTVRITNNGIESLTQASKEIIILN